MPILAGGLLITVELALVTIILSIFVAALLAVCNTSPWMPVRFVARLWVDLFRSVPTLALLIFVYYGLGKLTASWQLPPLTMAVVGLTLGESAFLSEVYRAGLEAIPKGQVDAASSLGLGWLSSMRLVILPQALVAAIPGTLNMAIFTIKDTSLASIIATPEVTAVAGLLVSDTFEPLQVYALLAVLYLALILPLTLFAGRIEAALDRRFGGLARATPLPW